jgi:hypothetical protein
MGEQKERLQLCSYSQKDERIGEEVRIISLGGFGINRIGGVLIFSYTRSYQEEEELKYYLFTQRLCC